MKLAILGRGKTGQKLIQLVQEKGFEHSIFSTQNPLSFEALKGHDAAISFLPGDPFLQSIPLLMEAGLPVVTGSTGFSFPKNLEEDLKGRQLSWICGHNFSLGMNLITQMIKVLSKADRLFEQFDCHIHEVHHVHKKDAPSGTALRWQEWFSHQTQISSERVGDVIGDHSLNLSTPTEQISLRHQALDRKVFAAGALWACDYLLKEKLAPGLYWFEELAQKELL